MKALVYTGTMQTEIRAAPEPEVAPGQAVVDIAFCGICGSDLHAWHGKDERRIPPLVLGHEAVGIVAGSDESGGNAVSGKRVAINPLMTCGECDVCRNGDEHLCARRELVGMRVPGGFAERMAINTGNIHPISDNLSFRDAALAEPLACAVHAVRLADVMRDKSRKVLILGGGAIGLLAAYVFRHYGFGNLIIAETNPHRRAMLDRLGIAETHDPAGGVDMANTADITFDAVGSGATRKAASSITRPGGCIIHIGLENNMEGLDTRRLTLQEIGFCGSYCYRRDDFATALELLENGVVTGAGWSEIRKLDDGAEAFMAIHEGRAAPKIILEIGGE